MRRFLISLIFVVMVCVAGTSEARKLALLVGVDDYDSVPSLKCCVNDMKTLKEALAKVGFEEDDIQVLVTGGKFRDFPTKKKIEQRLAEILAKAQPSDMVFFAFSGHGAQDGKTVYFCPPDVETDDLEGTCVSITKVMDDLAKCKAKFKWMVVDACRNDPTQGAKSIGGKGLQTVPAPPAGIALFQSCAEGEESWEDRGSGNGYFTKNFAAALAGAADTDHDGKLTLMEVCKWTTAHTKEQVMTNQGKSQKPYFSGSFSDFSLTEDLNVPKAKAIAAKARNKIEKGEYEEGIRLFDEAIQLYPKFKSWKRERDLAKQLIETNKNPGSLKAEELFKLGEKWATADHGKGELDWDKAANYYRQAAELGHARAMVRLGVCYSNGTGVKTDLTKSFHWIRQAAELKDPVAYLALGECYAGGIGVSRDKEAAKNWDSKGFDACYAQKDSGDPMIQYMLGYCYDWGLGTVKDHKEALKWFQKAAEQGDPEAQRSLGQCYMSGDIATRDEKEGIKWYRKAAKQGNPVAQTCLGDCYSFGQGVSLDETKAVEWYRKAAEQGYFSAQTSLGRCYENGTGVVKDYNEAVRWYFKAAEQEDFPAEAKLGNCYLNGIGVTKDEKEAVKWFRKAAEHGDFEAAEKLGECYRDGIGVKKNEAKAETWFQKAEELRESTIIFNSDPVNPVEQ